MSGFTITDGRKAVGGVLRAAEDEARARLNYVGRATNVDAARDELVAEFLDTVHRLFDGTLTFEERAVLLGRGIAALGYDELRDASNVRLPRVVVHDREVIRRAVAEFEGTIPDDTSASPATRPAADENGGEA